MEKLIVPLRDMDGHEENYELLDIVKFEGIIYTVFYPTKVGETQVLILRVDEAENPEESVYSFVEDKRIQDAVYKEFKEKYQKKYKNIIKFND